MDYRQNPVAAAVAADIIKLSLDGAGSMLDWSSIGRRIELFTGSAKGRSVLFLGSAISSLKPTHLPMWNRFVELIWISLLKVGLKHQPASKELFEEFKNFFDLTKGDVPNYLVTEIVSRRLGLQYLDLLEAFEAQRSPNDFDKSWALNNVHKWAARSLMTNENAAIVTTNFDNYLEKALEALNAVFYRVTGDAHQDGAEISARLPLVSSTQKLVLIVNGPKAFAFIRSLMPQLGAGKITFLFKLHGSCYDPPSCIDTRLQRSQGLPSYSTDILDTLLVRSMWLVAGFSGSDMNDNLDYLRLVSNKNHARVVWLENPKSYREKSLGRLVEVLDQDTDSSTGLCLINGYFVGERVSTSDKAPHFASKVLNWAESLGCDWCKLVTIDLVTLFKNKTGQQPRAELLQSLNHGEAPSQDWNLLLSEMSFSEQENQTGPARTCHQAKHLLESILAASLYSSEGHTEFCTRVNMCLKDLGRQHVVLERAALMSDPPRPHAQTWVLSSLSGLLMLCGGQLDAAMQSLEISAGLAWLVGDFESYHLIRGSITRIELEQHTMQTIESESLTSSDTTEPCVAFVPAMDNVNTKSNRFGVPPAVYIRALLHRSILFADGLAIPANVITCSTVFVDEILFQGELDVLDESLAEHLYPLLPNFLEDSSISNKFARYVTSRHQSYIQEPVPEKHIHQLDEYFSEERNSNRFLYYDEDSGSKNYGSLFRGQFNLDHKIATVKHLVQLWQHITPSGHWDAHREDNDRSVAAGEAAADVVKILRNLGATLPEKVYRSSLYKFADLFAGASDADAFIKDLRQNVDDYDIEGLILGRNRIVERPWLYGPYCHELFDIPYRCNLIFNQIARSKMHTLIFLEDDEIPSWRFISEIYGGTAASARLVLTPLSPSAEHKCSSLLLSQASKEVLIQSRESLGRVRAKLANGLDLTEEDARTIEQVIGKFKSRSLSLPDVKVEKLLSIQSPALLECVQDLLQRCVFLVRKGPPLDPMYEEAQLAVPGLYILQEA